MTNYEKNSCPALRLTQCSHLLAESDLITFKCGPNQNIGDKSAYKILSGNSLGEIVNEI
jgi:hypothetical protein